MRKMKTKKEIELAYNEAIAEMDECIEKAKNESDEYLKDMYYKESQKYAAEACTLAWVLGKDGY